MFFKWAIPSLFSVYFRLFKKTSLQFLQQMYAKNIHPVYSNGLQDISLLPEPLDQGSRPPNVDARLEIVTSGQTATIPTWKLDK